MTQKRARQVFMLVTQMARKLARDTSIYMALLTSAAAKYKVSTYLSSLQQWRDDIFIYGLYILGFFPGFFSRRQYSEITYFLVETPKISNRAKTKQDGGLHKHWWRGEVDERDRMVVNWSDLTEEDRM